LSEGYISYYTTVLGQDILRNVIVSRYVTSYQIDNLFVNIFSLLKKWPRGPDEMTAWVGFGPRAEVWRPLD